MDIGVNFIKYLFISLLLFSSCIPSFAPEKTLIKRIENESLRIEWYKQIGILDQRFPQIILLSSINETDTLCSAYNIKNVDLLNNVIAISFEGTPDCIQLPPNKWKDYVVVIIPVLSQIILL